jgi:hypothetical protein
VLVWVGDDTDETDGNPLQDADHGGPGHGMLTLVAQAHGPAGALRTVEVTLQRQTVAAASPGEGGAPDIGPVRVVTWRTGE